VIEVSLWRLALLLIPLVMVGWVSFRWVGKSGELVVATGRMVVQLLLVGYVLMWLFQVDGPWVTLGVVGFMILVSSWIAVRTVKSMKGKAFVDAVMAIMIGGGSVFALVLFGVLGLDPWYEPRYAIPLAGMIFANAMTAVTLSAERFDAEREGGKDVLGARNAAWNAALIPQVNSFLAVGLVSIPGMMTGQIIAGAEPHHAAHYQIMVMGMIFGAAGLAVAIFLTRVVREAREE
jgi:putative ABC transport system permease protein